jgi:hypothetical protein
MVDNKEKKFYIELLAESCKTNDVNLISQTIHNKLNINVSPNEVREILNEDYELECRKMEYSLEMSYMFE